MIDRWLRSPWFVPLRGGLASALPLVAVTGCLSLPESKPPQCKSTADCDSGEVCEEGMCWGNPPPGPFMVVVTPPIDRAELVPVESQLSEIPQDGWTGDLALDAGVTLSGRVEQADHTAVAATITITRPSSFTGGPGFHSVFLSKPEIAAPEPTYSVLLPLTTNVAYTLTIVPDGRADAPGPTVTPAQTVPPMQLSVDVAGSTTRTFQLGDASLPVISGTVQTTLGVKLSHYRVVALGHWQTDAPITEVSTVAYTGNDGAFSLMLSPGIVDNIDVVAKSYDGPAPVLHLGSIAPQTGTFTIVQPANVGNVIDVPIRIQGVDSGGEVVPVAGAVVSVAATTTPVFPATAFSTVLSEDTTGTDGTVHLKLLDGTTYNTLYQLRVIPPASSNLGVILDGDFKLEADHSDVRLSTRLAVHGIVVDGDGNPIAGVAVTTQPALRFMWSLDPSPQAFLSEIPQATAITTDAGDFVVYVDLLVDGAWGSYDFAFEPAAGSSAPNWLVPHVDLPRESNRTEFDLGSLTSPATANIHGRIVDRNTNPVPGGEIRLFTTPRDPTLCMQATHAPVGCPIPAILEGHGTSDDVGVVRMRLPRP
jgi:hypothetical protein